MKFKIRKNDFVQVTRGKDAGKKGRVIRVYPPEKKVLVEGVNFVKKHTRPKKIDRQGGIVQMEKPLSISNVMYFCMKCEKPTRIGYRLLEDKTKVRFCRGCEEVLEAR